MTRKFQTVSHKGHYFTFGGLSSQFEKMLISIHVTNYH